MCKMQQIYKVAVIQLELYEHVNSSLWLAKGKCNHQHIHLNKVYCVFMTLSQRKSVIKKKRV